MATGPNDPTPPPPTLQRDRAPRPADRSHEAFAKAGSISREDVAKLEIGITNVEPGVARTLGALFIELVCVLPLF